MTQAQFAVHSGLYLQEEIATDICTQGLVVVNRPTLLGFWQVDAETGAIALNSASRGYETPVEHRREPPSPPTPTTQPPTLATIISLTPSLYLLPTTIRPLHHQTSPRPDTATSFTTTIRHHPYPPTLATTAITIPTHQPPSPPPPPPPPPPSSLGFRDNDQETK
ncbi:extensin-like [Helianthus annuus]|uniref:extensin-like n=1 Tax=Helianthus annuus TaxID=4232 RepID=UPI000B9063D5|nr:extensin-like [Helianthus annuus]